MGTHCAPLIGDLFLFCYERDFMRTLSCDKEAEIIQAFNSTSAVREAQSLGHLTRKSVVLGSIPGLAIYFRFSFR